MQTSRKCLSNARNSIVSLVVAGYQAAFDRTDRGGNFLKWEPRPLVEAREKVTSKDPAVLLKDVEGAIKEKDQATACATRHAILALAAAAAAHSTRRTRPEDAGRP